MERQYGMGLKAIKFHKPLCYYLHLRIFSSDVFQMRVFANTRTLAAIFSLRSDRILLTDGLQENFRSFNPQFQTVEESGQFPTAQSTGVMY